MKVTCSQRVSEPPRGGGREGQRKKLLPSEKPPRRQGPDSSHPGNVTKETAEVGGGVVAKEGPPFRGWGRGGLTEVEAGGSQSSQNG